MTSVLLPFPPFLNCMSFANSLNSFLGRIFNISAAILSFYLSSDEDDIEPNIVVLKMQNPDPKGNGEFLDPVIREGVTHGSNDGTKEGKGLQKVIRTLGSKVIQEKGLQTKW